MKDRNGNEMFDSPEQVAKFIEWLFDEEVDKKLESGIEVNWRDYKKEGNNDDNV